MLDLHNPLVQLKITSSVCSGVALVSTWYRIWIRRGRLWWDDGFAVFSMLALLVQIAAVWMHTPKPDELSHLNRVAAYYIMATSFYVIIWTARISILLSIVRLDPSAKRRKLFLAVSGVFFVVMLVLLAQLFWICEPEPGWKNLASPQCKLNTQVVICQLVSDIIADTILITAPLKLLADLDDRRLRRRLMVIFSTCIVTSVVSLVHSVLILKDGGIKVVLAAIVEDTMSLIVCNVPVVVTATFHLGDGDRRQGSGTSSTYLHFSQNSQKTNGTMSSTAAATAEGCDDVELGRNPSKVLTLDDDNVPAEDTKTVDSFVVTSRPAVDFVAL